MNLKYYLDKNCINVSAFARKIGVSTPTLHRIASGKSPNLKIALLIEEATDGQVTCRDLMPKQ